MTNLGKLFASWSSGRRSFRLVRRYGFAFATAAGCLVIQRWLWPSVALSPYVILCPVAALTARFWGVGPSSAATATATAGAAVFAYNHGWLTEGSGARASRVLELVSFACVAIGITAAVGHMRVTLVRARAALVKAQQAKQATDATWSMVAHDLRTPLDVITIGTAALGSRSHLAPDMEKVLAMMKRSTKRATVLLDDALDAMRAAEGKLRVEPAECDPRELCAHALDAVSLLASRKGVRLESDVSALHALLCDQPRLEQVLTNLLGNSIKFTPPLGVVSLYVDEAEDGLHFSVRDTGSGIPKEELDSIFTKFWSGSTGGGSGLGLWIACAILEAHHAQLTVESRVGVGTTFRFTLPKALELIAREPPEPSSLSS